MSVTATMKHAVVLGAGMGGLLAARAASNHFDKVTIVERDPLVDEVGSRKGVPQGRHAHGLLTAGIDVFSEFFPGFIDEVVTVGGAKATGSAAAHWVVGGKHLRYKNTDEVGVTCGRPAVEHVVRSRVRALENVTFRTEHDVLGIRHEAGTVKGARIRDRKSGAEETIDADLVVDASGRGSKLPQWLEALGYPVPREERVKIGIEYITGVYPRAPGSEEIAFLIGAKPPNKRCGVALALDRDHWIVTLAGYHGERVRAMTHEAYVEFARGLPSLHIHDLIWDLEPVDELVSYSFPSSQRRYYEELGRHPEGLIAFGDAISSFNPIFGQGMSVAALGAKKLDAMLVRGGKGLWRGLYREMKRVIDVPWGIVIGNDLRYDDVEGKRPFGASLVNGYMDRLIDVASRDEDVGYSFLRVIHLVDPPSTLFAPKTLARVIRG